MKDGMDSLDRALLTVKLILIIVGKGTNAYYSTSTSSSFISITPHNFSINHLFIPQLIEQLDGCFVSAPSWTSLSKDQLTHVIVNTDSLLTPISYLLTWTIFSAYCRKWRSYARISTPHYNH